MIERPWKILALILILRKVIVSCENHVKSDRNLNAFWGPYSRHHYQNPNIPIKIPEREIKERINLTKSLPLRLDDKPRKKSKSLKRKKSKNPKSERNLKFKKNLEHSLQSIRNDDYSNGKNLKSGEEFEQKKHKAKGHKTKMHYDKASSFERGRKGAYARSFGDKKNRKKKQRTKVDLRGDTSEEKDYKKSKIVAEENSSNENGENLHLKKKKKKAKKNKAYHNVFMKDEYKKDRTLYGE